MIKTIHPSDNDRIRGIHAGFVTFDEAATPWGLRSFKVTAERDRSLVPFWRPGKTDVTFARIAWSAAKHWQPSPMPSREVALSFIGAQ